MALPQAIVSNIKNTTQKTLIQMQPTKVPKSTFTKVKQRVSKSFTSFINNLTQAIKKPYINEIAQPDLLQRLAFANTNKKYKHIISTLPDPQPTLHQIKTWSKTSTPQHVTTIQTNTSKKQFKKFLETTNQKLKPSQLFMYLLSQNITC